MNIIQKTITIGAIGLASTLTGCNTDKSDISNEDNNQTKLEKTIEFEKQTRSDGRSVLLIYDSASPQTKFYEDINGDGWIDREGKSIINPFSGTTYVTEEQNVIGQVSHIDSLVTEYVLRAQQMGYQVMN